MNWAGLLCGRKSVGRLHIRKRHVFCSLKLANFFFSEVNGTPYSTGVRGRERKQKKSSVIVPMDYILYNYCKYPTYLTPRF